MLPIPEDDKMHRTAQAGGHHPQGPCQPPFPDIIEGKARQGGAR